MKGQTSLSTMQLPNQRPGKSDKTSQNACNPDKPSHNAMQNTLNKRDCKAPNTQTSRAPIRRTKGTS